MKKLILLALMALVFGACQKTVDPSISEPMLKSGALKVNLCHWDSDNQVFVTISVGENAVPAHLAHGDKLAYSPQGSYEALFADVYLHDFIITEFNQETGEFSGIGGYPAKSTWEEKNITEYEVHEILTGTVTDGIISGRTTYVQNPNYPDPYYEPLTGTVDECGGIVSLDSDAPIPFNNYWVLVKKY